MFIKGLRRFKVAYEYIKSDAFRYCANSRFRTVLNLCRQDVFRWQVIFRLRQEGCFGSKFLCRVAPLKRHLQIAWATKIGYGLYISHGGPLVVNGTATIGNNCNLSQFTTIGANEGQAANIGDNVYIGPGVSVVENVRIGSNVTIGAGSVVTKDIPDNATAAGNYAKVLNYNDPGRYVSNRWRLNP